MAQRLTAKMSAALTAYNATGDAAGIHPRTRRALEQRGLLTAPAPTTETAMTPADPVAELIGGMGRFVTRTSPTWNMSPTRDWTLADQVFWDGARRGKKKGLALAAALLKPICSKIAAWTMGMSPVFEFDDPYTQQQFADWFAANHPDVLRGYEESLNLGNVHVLANADLTLSIIPTHIVEPIVDDDDYSQLLGWRITEVFSKPDVSASTMKVIEEYTATGRRQIKQTPKGERTTTYRNLIGVIPVFLLANMPGVDEYYGRPEAETLLNVLYEYDDLMYFALLGNKKKGRPTPVIHGFQSDKGIAAFRSMYARSKTRTADDGQQENWDEYDINLDELLLLLGDARLSYESPGAFMADAQILLEILYYLILEHTELPEFLMGTAVSSSKASVAEQLPPFVKFIEKKQGLTVKWLRRLAQVVTGYMSLTDPKIKAGEPKRIRFAPLMSQEGKLTIEAVALGLKAGLLDRETALRLLPLDIENPEAVLKKVDKEQAAAADAFERNVDKELERAEQRLKDEENDDTVDTDDEESEDTRADEMVSRLLVDVEL